MTRFAPLALLALGCAEDPSLQPGYRCLAISPDLSVEAQQATLDALDAWAPLPVAIEVEIGGSCPNVVAMRDSNYWTENPQAHAYTRKVWSGAERAETAIHIKPGAWSECALTAVLTHEIGHFLGTSAHSHEHGSIMQPYVKPCSGETVTEADREAVWALY